MVVVLGHEKRHVDDAHLLIQTRMERCFGQARGVPTFERGDEMLSAAPETVEDLAQGPGVVVRLARFAVLHVGGTQDTDARAVVVQSRGVQIVEVAQMSRMLLYR